MFHLLSETLPFWGLLVWNTEMDLEESRGVDLGSEGATLENLIVLLWRSSFPLPLARVLTSLIS